MDIPKDVIAETKKGKKEVRWLVSRGEFVWYEYRDVKDLKKVGKSRIFLKSKDGEIKSFFLIPLKDEKMLAIEADKDENKKIWNDKTKKVEDLW